MNGHDFTLEQNTEARMMLAVARRGLAAAINDAENGIGHLSCDDPKIMEQVRAHWRRLYDTYMNADALLSDLESCARHLTDGDKWEPNPIADGMKPMEMAKGCACFIAETPDGGLIIPSEPTAGREHGETSREHAERPDRRCSPGCDRHPPARHPIPVRLP